jgi:leucyl-tRNA synthetase
MEFAADATSESIQETVWTDERSLKWTEGKTPKK